MATLTLSFEDILDGAAGSTEASAARRWLDAGAPLYAPPPDLVAGDDGAGLDLTIRRLPASPRRPAGGHGLLASPTVTAAPAQAAQAATPQWQTPAGSDGLAARRARAPFELPHGWQVQPVRQKAARQSAQQQEQQQQQQQRKRQRQGSTPLPPLPPPPQQRQYVSPEGLVLPSLQDVQDVLEGPVVLPRRLVAWVRAAAARPLAAAEDAATTRGRALMLAARRVRICRVEGERRQFHRRLAAAAAAAAGAGGGSRGRPATERRLRPRGTR